MYQSLKKRINNKMNNPNLYQPDITNLYDGPSDDELREIEDKLEKITDLQYM